MIKGNNGNGYHQISRHSLKRRFNRFVVLSKQWTQARSTEGEALREFRQKFGLTMDEAVPLLGIGKPYISLLETGRALMTQEVAERAILVMERLETFQQENRKALLRIGEDLEREVAAK
jgi:hypothetical protein